MIGSSRLNGKRISACTITFIFISAITFLFLRQSPRLIPFSNLREYNFVEPILLNRDAMLSENGNNSAFKTNSVKNGSNSNLFNPTLELAKLMTTEQLGQLVLSNCRLTNYIQGETSKNKYESAIKTVATVRPTKKYRWPAVLHNGKSVAYCLNTKAGSTYLRQNILQGGSTAIFKAVPNYKLVNAFMVIREPMHRLLSAYLNKLRDCEKEKGLCGMWRSFAQNIAQFVKNVNKSQSNLFRTQLEKVEAYQVSFSDFIDYVIHMYLRNDGKVMDPTADFDTPQWVWWHWQSVVQDRCFVCAAVWTDVVLFENLAEHLQQVFPKYPELFEHPEKLSSIKTSKTDDKTEESFHEISDFQLWFLGNVMYALDYAILPYDFNDFCKSINRFNVTKSKR